MNTVLADKKVIELIKKGFSEASNDFLKNILEDVFENSYEFILCDSNCCELEELPTVIGNRLEEKNESSFIDSELEFSDLTDSIEHSIYKALAFIVEKYDESYSEDIEYDMEEDNQLCRTLIDIYAASCIWADFRFDKESDMVAFTTYNILGTPVIFKFDIAHMGDKEYICEVLATSIQNLINNL